VAPAIVLKFAIVLNVAIVCIKRTIANNNTIAKFNTIAGAKAQGQGCLGVKLLRLTTITINHTHR
jgi:hypothetical protein